MQQYRVAANLTSSNYSELWYKVRKYHCLLRNDSCSSTRRIWTIENVREDCKLDWKSDHQLQMWSFREMASVDWHCSWSSRGKFLINRKKNGITITELDSSCGLNLFQQLCQLLFLVLPSSNFFETDLLPCYFCDTPVLSFAEAPACEGKHAVVFGWAAEESSIGSSCCIICILHGKSLFKDVS